MTLKLRPALLFMTATVSLGVSACGESNDPSDAASDTAVKAAKAGAADAPKNSVSATPPTLADGPDVCFRAIAKHLGAETKVSEITSFFSEGKEIDGTDTKPEGEMTTCTVTYQSPEDPRKLMSTRLDIASGKFDPPSPVEIMVNGGNAADFRLDDYLIPLSKVDAAASTAIMEAQKARLGGVYSRYAWSGVRLSPPGPFSDTHTLRLDITGRLASNDIKENGYASLSTDGKRITTDHLLP